MNKIMLAIDGGGTKTEFLLFDEYGIILNHMILPGSNPNSCGIDNALKVLKNGIEIMLSAVDVMSGVYMGIAGLGELKNKRKILRYFNENYPDIHFEVESDYYNVLNSYVPSESYISVICGTGSVVSVKTKQRIERLGGYGYLFDHTCSGYSFGHAAVYAALKQEDGVGNKTIITELVEKYLGGRALDNLSKIYSADKTIIANMGQFVFDSYDKGDAVAEEIIESNTSELSVLINTAISRFGTEKYVTLSGGVMKRADVLLPYLKKKSKGIEFVVIDMPQIYGAAIYCCQQFSVLTDEFQSVLKENYKKYWERVENVENRNA